MGQGQAQPTTHLKPQHPKLSGYTRIVPLGYRKIYLKALRHCETEKKRPVWNCEVEQAWRQVSSLPPINAVVVVYCAMDLY